MVICYFKDLVPVWIVSVSPFQFYIIVSSDSGVPVLLMCILYQCTQAWEPTVSTYISFSDGFLWLLEPATPRCQCPVKPEVLANLPTDNLQPAKDWWMSMCGSPGPSPVGGVGWLSACVPHRLLKFPSHFKLQMIICNWLVSFSYPIPLPVFYVFTSQKSHFLPNLFQSLLLG